MAKSPYAFAPEADEADHGVVKLADDYAVWHEFTPAEARAFAHAMLAAADFAEDRPDVTPKAADQARAGRIVVGYVVVDSLGGVFQNVEASPGVMPVTIDWDEINDTSDEEALAYAKSVLHSIEALPADVAARWKADVTTALDDRGLTLPE